MITKYKKHHRIIATVFLIIFFPTLVPNNLFASNNGPKSPEAASFEPVDATDMVNLITGQYSYVLPLLNVPSPEGGYPIALGYHAGIALEQESSWTGLGWNVNPGAIDRSVNGYPDDYNASQLNEYFWDRTYSDTRYTASIGYSCGVASVAVGFNWGSNQALGGTVSVGVGYFTEATGSGAGVSASVGFGSNSGYISIGVNAQLTSGLTLGANADTYGNVGVSAGFNNNGEGFSVGYNTNGTTSLSIGASTGNDNIASLDISFSSSGVGISGGVTNKTGKNIDGGVGAGMSVSFNNSVSVGDYSTSSSGWMIPFVVPTHIGVFSGSFGKQEFKYWLGKNDNNYVTGSIYFKNGVKDVTKKKKFPIGRGEYVWRDVIVGKAFMDINELSLNAVEQTLSSETNVAGNNMTFPGYDNLSVSAQGVSGSMSATLYKNGALFGLDGKENKEGYALKYAVNGNNASDVNYLKFNAKPQFDFDNEITGYLGVAPALFNNSTNISNALNYYTLNSTDINDKARRKTSSYIEYFTNEEITTDSSYAVLKANGFLLPSVSGFDRSTMPKDGIGAYKITTVDGKTYHYSLPVYNHEIITRTNGAIRSSPEEWQSYFEKRQLEPFATHWVLTAVTGPDFVDNGDGIAGDGDLGYWTSFEYGKWTDAFVWKNPYKKEVLIDDKDPKIKTWIRGRKQLYYLDKIKTRTHTALFIKGIRQDTPSPQWDYNSADHIDGKQNNVVVNRFTIPSQNQLRLEKIVLLKNADVAVDKTYGLDSNQNVYIKYNQSVIKEDEEAKYNIYDNVLDLGDNWQGCIAKAVKVIDFGYDYSLVPGDNRLSLRSVDFRGKGGTSVLPPYKFDYINDTNTFNIDNKDGYGYLLGKPETFSLNKITTPQGGIININYESNKFKSVTDVNLEFLDYSEDYHASEPVTTTIGGVTETTLIISMNRKNIYPDILNKSVQINYSEDICNGYYSTVTFYSGTGHIIQNLGNGNYKVKFDGTLESGNGEICDENSYDLQYRDWVPEPKVLKVSLNLKGETFISGGPRVSNLKVYDGADNYVTDYKYGLNEDGIGYVSYVPYSQNVAKEVPYSAELPAPRVMYEYVNMSSHKEGIEALSKMRYKFNIMKEKSPDRVKFGSFYEIVKTVKEPFVNNTANKEVSINSYIIKENFAALGQLLEVVTLNSKNQLLSKVYSTYYDINEIPNNMGVTQESYQSYKEVDYLTNTSTLKDKWIINSSTRIKYPSIIKSSTEQKNGYTYTTQFNDYDLISGVSKEQLYSSSDGQYYKTKVIPAYIKYSGMGSKVDNITNKNMLSQTAATYSYIYDGTDAIKPWKETGVGITTWSNVWAYKDIAGLTTEATAPNQKIWRKHKTFVWNGVQDANGIFINYSSNNGNDDSFNWNIPTGVGIDVTQPAQWKQTSEVTLYDHFSAPLEMKDINENYASTKMGDGDTKVMATGNARYTEMFYAGAENTPINAWLEPEVQMTNTSRNTAYFHTGKYSVQAASDSQFGVVMKNGQHSAGKYRVSVWVEKANAANAAIKVNGSIIPFKESYTAGNWVFKSAIVEVPLSECSIYIFSNTRYVYLDDLMIRPVASSISGYVYNQWDELTHIIGNNGLATRFEYDNAGRLVKTYSEVIDDAANGVTGGFKLAKTNTYNNKYMQ
jgi:hypothetical protein